MEKFAIKIDDAVKASLYKICRLCGIDNPKKVPILSDTANIDVDEPGLSQKIENLVNMIVTANDKMPQTICMGCHDKICDFYDFKELCHATETQTRSLLGLDPIKTDKNSDDKIDLIHFKEEGLVTGGNCSLKRGRKRKSDDSVGNKASSSSAAEIKTESSSSELNNNKRKRIMETRTTKNQEGQQQPKQLQQQVKKELGGTLKTTKKYFKTCGVCSNRFEDKKSLEKHQREMHVPNVHRYFCIACDVALSNSADIKTHQTWHKTLRRPYVCGLCDDLVPNFYAYTKHLHGHDRSMPFGCRVYNRECPKCRGSFATNYLYNIHHCAIETRRCGGCGNILMDQNKYLRHAAICRLTYYVHSKYIPGEVAETESQVLIKNEATEPERDVDAVDAVDAVEWSMPQKKTGKRDSAKEFQMRADKLLKSTMVTLGSIKLEPEVHLDDNLHHDHHDHHADANANEVEQENVEENRHDNDFNFEHHFNTNSDSDEDEANVSPIGAATPNAAVATSADSNVSTQLLNENNAIEDYGRDLDVKKELLGMVPSLKLKITNKEGQLNSSFTSDDSGSRHEKKKKKKKNKDEKRQKISYEVSPPTNLPSPGIKIKTENLFDEDDDDESEYDNSLYEEIRDSLEVAPAIMTAIPMTQTEISSIHKAYTMSGIDVNADAAAMLIPTVRITARKSTAGVSRMITRELNDSLRDDGNYDNDESPEVTSIGEQQQQQQQQQYPVKQEPIDEDIIQIKQELVDSSEHLPTQIPSGFHIVPIKQEIVEEEDVEMRATVVAHPPQIPAIRSADRITARKSTAGGHDRIQEFLNRRIKREIVSEDDEPSDNPVATNVTHTNPSMRVTARKSTSGLPRINQQQVGTQAETHFPPRIPAERSDGSAVRLTARKSTGGIQIKQEQLDSDNNQTQAVFVRPQIPSTNWLHKNSFATNATASESSLVEQTLGIANIRIKQEISDDTTTTTTYNEAQAVTQQIPIKNNESGKVKLTARKSTGGIPFLNRQIKQEPSDDEQAQIAFGQDNSSTSTTTSMITYKNPFTNYGYNVSMPQIVSVEGSAPRTVVVKEEPNYWDYPDSSVTAQQEQLFNFNDVTIKKEKIDVQQGSADVVGLPNENTNILEHGEIEEGKEIDTFAADVAEEALEDVVSDNSSNIYLNNDPSTTSLGLLITNVQAAVPKCELDGHLPIASTTTTTTASSSSDMMNTTALALNNIDDELVVRATNDPATFSGNVEYKKDHESQAQPVLDDLPSTSSASTATSATMLPMPNYSNDEEEQQNVLNHELLAQNAVQAAEADALNEESENQINEQQMQLQQDEQLQLEQQPQPLLMQQQLQFVYDSNNVNEIAENNNNANIERELGAAQQQQEQHQQQNLNNHEEHLQDDDH